MLDTGEISQAESDRHRVKYIVKRKLQCTTFDERNLRLFSGRAFQHGPAEINAGNSRADIFK